MFTMPITINKPVNFILFSIVLLVIMGLCICIAPDTAYAVTETAPMIPLACPRPPEGEGQAWVAVSNGFDVRVFILYMQHAAYEASVPGIGSNFSYGFRISELNIEDRLITFNIGMPLNMDYYCSVVRWDSDGPTYRVMDIRRVADGQNNLTFQTWVDPGYIAWGGDIAWGDDGYSQTSFVPLWNYSGSSTGSSENYWSVLNSISESLLNINRISGNIEEFSEQSSSNLSNIKTLLTSIERIQQSLGLAVVTHSDGDEVYYSVSSSIDRFTSPELFSVLDELSLKLSSLESLTDLSDSIDRLNQVVAQMEDSFTQISQDLQELTAAIEAETEIWEDASSSYYSSNFSDNSVDSWSWLARFFNRFSDVGSFERSTSDDFYSLSVLSPGDSGHLSTINWYDVFTFFLSTEAPQDDPSVPDTPAQLGYYSSGWYSLDLGGLP